MRKRSADPLASPGGARIVFAFAAVSYVAWLLVFGIYRYILTLEMLASLVIVAAVGGWPIGRQARLALLAVLAVLVMAATRADFLERAPLGDPYVQVKLPPIPHPDDTVILMTGEAPMGYLVPELPHQIPVLRIDGWLIQPDDGSALTAETRARVAAFKGELYLIAAPDEIDRTRKAVAGYGLALAPARCADIEANLGGPYDFCPLARKAKPKTKP